MRLARPRKTRPDVWVAVADPVGRLSEALEEASEIQALFDEHQILSRLTDTATEDHLRKTRADCTILHFATHGFVNPERPSDSYLEMASPPGDGKLMQKEIWRLKRELPALRAKSLRLVVLSACETARAQDAPQAEVLGLPDAFFYAGVPAVVGSLWSVYSWSTTDLMVEFYRRLREEGQDLATALLGARRAMLADRANGRYAHPYFWAPFLLFGDWR
jgi:CHAT domain-containing protein